YLWAVGYVDCFIELQEQLDQRGVQPSHVYVCANLMTHAGLLLGAHSVGAPFDIVGINPSHHRPETRSQIAELANEAGRFLGLDVNLTTSLVDNRDDYAGEGYGQPT